MRFATDRKLSCGADGLLNRRRAAVLAAAALLSGCGPEVALDGLADAGVARVGSAASGDRLVTSAGELIVLAGVAAPGAGEPYAAEARAVLRRLAEGREVRLLRAGAVGSPVHVRDARDRRWIQQALLEQGAARVRTSPENPAMAREMLRAEAQARTRGRGLWALADYEVRLPREVVAGRLQGFQIVEGRVRRAAEAGGRLFLEFDADWRGGFSSETPLGTLARFEAAGVDLRAMEGRLVRLRGEVRPTGYGPRLTLDHPEQIERLRDPRP